MKCLRIRWYLWGVLITVLAAWFSHWSCAQPEPNITDFLLTPDGRVVLTTDEVPAGYVDCLEQTPLLTGPWWDALSVTGSTSVSGHTFEGPADVWGDTAFYRVRREPQLPWIRWMAPTRGMSGDVFTIVGEHFSDVPAENQVIFRTPDTNLTATLYQATSTMLEGWVPVGVAPPSAVGTTNYLVQVQVDGRISSGVAFQNYEWNSYALTIKPESVWLLMPPGRGVAEVVVAGGTPPYHLLPLDAWAQTQLSALLTGNVITLTGLAAGNNVDLGIEDSSDPPLSANLTVYLRDPWFELAASDMMFHTLLAGSAPGLNLHTEMWAGNLAVTEAALFMDGVEARFNDLVPLDTIGVINFGRREKIYGSQLLMVTSVDGSGLQFEAQMTDDDGYQIVTATGTISKNPAVIRLRFAEVPPAALMGQSIDTWLVLDDGIFSLPSTIGMPVTVEARYSSTSPQAAAAVPLTWTTSTLFQTTGPAAPAPRIQRLLPIHGEVGRYVEIHGDGFHAEPGSNLVTFAGPEGSRIEAPVESVEPDYLLVAVPEGSVSGPVQVESSGSTSNPFHFMVRFRPTARITVPYFIPGDPVGPVLTYEQPDRFDPLYGEPGEYADEVDFAYWTATLDSGGMNVAALAAEQVAGSTDLYDVQDDVLTQYEVRYFGQESTGAMRHRFDIRLQPGRTNTVARIFLSELEPDGVLFELVPVLKVDTGKQWTITFTEPVYDPPATAGLQVNTRTEVVSVPWLPVPGTEMRVGRAGFFEIE